MAENIAGNRAFDANHFSLRLSNMANAYTTLQGECQEAVQEAGRLAVAQPIAFEDFRQTVEQLRRDFNWRMGHLQRDVNELVDDLQLVKERNQVE